MPRVPIFDRVDDYDHDLTLDLNANARRRRPTPSGREPRYRPRQRRNETAPFRCGRCRSMIEPPAAGGRYRNHCPLCLTSRHVDATRPGDRACPCRALMPAVGTYFRAGGEQMLVHRCNGCGAERTNRVAADDQPAVLRRLILVPPPARTERATDDEAIA